MPMLEAMAQSVSASDFDRREKCLREAGFERGRASARAEGRREAARRASVGPWQHCGQLKYLRLQELRLARRESWAKLLASESTPRRGESKHVERRETCLVRRFKGFSDLFSAFFPAEKAILN